MVLDPTLRRRGEFPVDQPLEALKTDHSIVRHFFDRYFHTHDADGKRDIGRHILLLLEDHTALEERVFYPRVRDADPSLIDHCEQEHEQAKKLIERLKFMDKSDPQIEPVFRELKEAIFKHVDTEEQQLFPKVQQASLDLSDIGHEMQVFEVQQIADRSQRPPTPGLRV